MTTPAWPTGLPCQFQIEGLGYLPLSNGIAIEPEVGAPMTRLRFTGDMVDISGSFTFKTRAKAQVLLAFWKDTCLRGTLPFTWKDPVSGAAVTMVFMAAPQFKRAGNVYSASISLRTKP